MNRNREVVILTNIKSEYIEEAILILKENAVKDRGKALREAEKIIVDYSKRCDGIRCRRRKQTFHWLPVVCTLAVLMIPAILLIRLL